MSRTDISHTISTLRGICHTAEKIRKLTKANATQATSPKSPHPVPELQLAFPEEVLSTLKSMDLPMNVYGNLQKRLFSWYQRMHTVHQQHYVQTCQRLCSMNTYANNDSTFESIRLAFEASFSKRYVPIITSHVRNLKERYQCESSRSQKACRQPFQQAFAPLLEQYFDQNAYPSAADRVTLAKRTMNTPRQIEVWFQNHRNRARKDGKTLKRSNSPRIICDLFSSFGSPVDSESLSDQCYYVTSEDDQEREFEGEHSTLPTAKAETPDLLNPPRPAHSFPTTFSEPPFQKEARLFKFSPLNWPRQPASVPPRSGLPVNFDAFIAEFAEKLNLRDKSPKKQMPSSHKRRSASAQPWFSSTVVVPPKAPLPSLVRTLSSCPPSTSCSGSIPSKINRVRSFGAIDPPFRRHCTPQSRTEIPYVPRLSSVSSRTYPLWGSRTSSLSSNSSSELITPPITPSAENPDFKIVGVDDDFLQEFFSPTTSNLITDTFRCLDIPFSKESTSFPIPSLPAFV